MDAMPFRTLSAATFDVHHISDGSYEQASCSESCQGYPGRARDRDWVCNMLGAGQDRTSDVIDFDTFEGQS
jgi:hypothetical protein